MTRDATELINSTDIFTYDYIADNSFGVGFLAEYTDSWLSGKSKKEHVIQNSIGVLFKAFQEENARVKDLQERVKVLEELVTKLVAK